MNEYEYKGLNVAEGFDTIESVEKIPKGFGGYVWTNRIDLISEK